MKTKIINPDENNIELLANEIKKGEVIALPTETVYGLSANALDENAVKKIFNIKNRPANNPLIVHVSDLEMLNKVCYVTNDALMLINKYWPGPLTLLLKKRNIIPDITTAGLDTVAVRMPESLLFRQIIDKSNCPIAAPSANTSGKPSPTSAKHVYDDLKGKIKYILDGGQSYIGIESTILKLSEKPYKLLRPGFITYEDLLSDFDNIEIPNSILNIVDKNTKIESPGMLYKHYSPNSDLYLLIGDENESIQKCIDLLKNDKNNNINSCVVCFDEHISDYKGYKFVNISSKDDLKKYASSLFSILRNLDIEKIEKAYFEVPNTSGIGLAIMNRLLRAAAFKIIKF